MATAGVEHSCALGLAPKRPPTATAVLMDTGHVLHLAVAEGSQLAWHTVGPRDGARALQVAPALVVALHHLGMTQYADMIAASGLTLTAGAGRA
jgi:hypothetical protein